MMDRPDLTEIQAAAHDLRSVVQHTPLVPLHSFEGESDILLKPEIHQVVTSFKIRGVYHAVASLSEKDRQAGLSTVSAGNTAQALAWVGRHFGVASRSIMPNSAPVTKIEAVKRYGGEPILVPIEQVFRFLKEHQWESEPFAFIHPWTERNVWIGHGTIGLEIIEDEPAVDTVYIPVGGGGLITGVGSALKALKPTVRLVAVEPQGCPSLFESVRQGKAVSVECDTLCDGVAVPYMTEELFPLVRDLIDDVVLVSEERVKSTIKRLALGNRMIVEGSGALAVAAAIDTPQQQRGRSIALITGGSIDTQKLIAILNDPEIAP